MPNQPNSKVTKKDCQGCRDNFYNGNNNLGVSECWMFKSATMEKKLDVPTDLRPPYKMSPVSRPNCYKAKGYVRVAQESLTKDGFWKGF